MMSKIQSTILVLIPLLVTGCASPGTHRLWSMTIPEIAFKQESYSNVIARVNTIVAELCPSGCPPLHVTLDLSLPKIVIVNIDGSHIHAAQRVIDSGILEHNLHTRNLSPVTLSATNLTLGEVVQIISNLGDMLLTTTREGAVIRPLPPELHLAEYPLSPRVQKMLKIHHDPPDHLADHMFLFGVTHGCSLREIRGCHVGIDWDVGSLFLLGAPPMHVKCLEQLRRIEKMITEEEYHARHPERVQVWTWKSETADKESANK